MVVFIWPYFHKGGLPTSRPNTRNYLSAGGIAITRTARPETRGDALDTLAAALDERLGVLLTSSFEYPEHYTRWDMGFCEYAATVRDAIAAFRRGDLFEVVPGQTFFEPGPAPPTALYRRLK